jgi:hypothetical protein
MPNPTQRRATRTAPTRTNDARTAHPGDRAHRAPTRAPCAPLPETKRARMRAPTTGRVSLTILFAILHNAPMRICPMPVCAYAGMRPCKQALYAPMRLEAYAGMRLKPYAGMPVCAYASKRRMRIGAYADMPVCAYAPKSLLIMRRNSKCSYTHKAIIRF